MDSESGGAAKVVPPGDDATVLFISHRHEDVAIADALRRFIDARTGGRVRVHQSSAANAEGPRQGQNITAELRRALWNASVLVLVYTTREHDWSYCMWECGVAQLPEPADTRTIVFQCSDQVPAVFADQLRVDVRSEVDVEKFVTDLLTDDHYFPKLGRAVTEFHASTEPVKDAARDLHARLQELVDGSDSVDEWPPYPQLTLRLGDDLTERIRVAQGSSEERVALLRQTIVDEATVIGGDSQVGRIFGVPGFPRAPAMPGVTLSRLVSSWQNDTTTPGSRWVDAMCSQMISAVRGTFPTLRWELMRGVDGLDMAWYGPVVRYYKKTARGGTEVDVVFCKFQVDAEGRARIGVPEVEPDR